MQPFGKIHNKLVQKPPRSTCPLHPPARSRLQRQSTGSCRGRSEGSPACHQLQTARVFIRAAWGRGVAGGALTLLFCFCTDFRNSLSRLGLSESARVSFASRCFSSLNQSLAQWSIPPLQRSLLRAPGCHSCGATGLVLGVLPPSGAPNAFGWCRAGGSYFHGTRQPRCWQAAAGSGAGSRRVAAKHSGSPEHVSPHPVLELGCPAPTDHCVHASNKASARCWARAWATMVPPHKPPAPGDGG